MSEKDLFDEEFGDLLDDVKEVKEQPKKVEETKDEGFPPEDPNPIDFEKANEQFAKAAAPKKEENSATTQFVPFGTKVSATPFKRFKAAKDQKARFAILGKEALPIKTHYVEGIGNFVCFDGKCCEMEGLPRVRYLIPIVVYTVNKNGSVVGDDIDLQVLSLGADQYDALATAIQFSGRGLRDVDIICTCSDEQYQKLTFTADGTKGATWVTFGTAKELAARYKANKDKLYTAVARVISAETYLQKKGFLTPAASNPTPPLPPTTKLEDLLDE